MKDWFNIWKAILWYTALGNVSKMLYDYLYMCWKNLPQHSTALPDKNTQENKNQWLYIKITYKILCNYNIFKNITYIFKNINYIYIFLHIYFQVNL